MGVSCTCPLREFPPLYVDVGKEKGPFCCPPGLSISNPTHQRRIAMSRAFTWNLPTRFFHWLLSAGLITAAAIALLPGEDSPVSPYYAIIGLTIGLMVCRRLTCGVVGTRYARFGFGTFVFGPAAVIEYLKGTLLGGGKRYVGQNPGFALAIFALPASALATAETGIMPGHGNESVKDFHEIIACAIVGVAVVHVPGVALHTLRHRENNAASMIHGKKNAEPSAAILSSQPIVAVISLICSRLRLLSPGRDNPFADDRAGVLFDEGGCWSHLLHP